VVGVGDSLIEPTADLATTEAGVGPRPWRYGGVHQNSLGALTLLPPHHHRTPIEDARTFDQIAVRYAKSLKKPRVCLIY
jgi:hypothetical protein